MISKKQIAADYDVFWQQGFRPSDDWTQLGAAPLRMQAIRLLAPSKARILDVGCGNGLALAALQRQGLSAIGCDISLRALQDARRHGDVTRADACHLPFRSGSFRYLLMLDALEHVIEKPALIRECHRVLSEAGEMVLTTPLPKATGGRGDERQPYDKPATYREIMDMTAGRFRLQTAKGVGWIPRRLGRLTRIVPGPLYITFPAFLENSTEVLLLFKKQ